jgi:hypothetical protein
MQAKSRRLRETVGISLLAALAMVLISGGEPPQDLAHCGAVSSGGVVMENGSAMIMGQPVAGIASSADHTVRFGLVHCLNAIATVPTSCPADFDGSGNVEAFDLAILLGAWGPCPEPCKEGNPEDTCPADLNGDCVVEAFDLALLLGNWGPCE